MKSFSKIIFYLIPGLFFCWYVSHAHTALHFIYLLSEALLILWLVAGTPMLLWYKGTKTKIVFFAFLMVCILFACTHVSRIIWRLVDLENQSVEMIYFFKDYLLLSSLEVAYIPAILGGVIGFILWFSKLSSKKQRRVGLALLGSSVIISLSFYLYLNRDLSTKGIHFDYRINTMEEITQLAQQLEKNLYVDFWHSGCAPCLKEFENQPVFSEEVDDKKVHFLYLGTDRSVPGEKQKQRLLIEKYDLGGTHTFITKEEFSDILDEAGFQNKIHGYKAFPHHMIINSKGEITDIKAGKPTSELAHRLNNLN